MTNRQKTLQELSESIKLAEVFLLKYDSKLPEDFGSICLPTSNVPVLSFFAREENRDQVLTLCGDVFGRSGWDATETYSRRGYDWRKTIDGVVVCIYDAQLIDAPASFPVSPTQFPIQLTDAHH